MIMRPLYAALVLCISAMSALAADVPSVAHPLVESHTETVSRPNGVLILPFEDLSGVPEAERELAALIAQRMTANGWTIVTDENLEQRLERDRVRYLDSLPAELTRQLVAETGASAVLMSTIYLYDDGRSPTVALSARLVRADGVVLWGDAVALSSTETEGVFGFGKRSTRPGVAALAVESLLERFPKPGTVTGVVPGGHGPVLSVSKREFAAPDLATPDPKRVFVLPFRNFAYDGASARIVADMLTLRLAAARGLTVVSPAERGLTASWIRASAPSPLGPYRSDWMLLARGAPAPEVAAAAAEPPTAGAGAVTWTDDFAPLLPLL